MSFVSSGPSLSQGDIERFSRQIIGSGIGPDGMERLKQACVLCVGAGGLGSTAALYLAAAGVGKIIIVDGDEVELSNLHRQIIHDVDDIGRNKAESAKQSCQNSHPFTQIEPIPEMITIDNVEPLVQKSSVVVDCTDNVASRYILNDAAMRYGIPLISGAAMRWEGQLSVYGWEGGPCYRCLFPDPPPKEAVGSCNDTGVIGPIPGMIGCLQALETIKLLAGMGITLSGRMFFFDGLTFTTRVATLRKKVEGCRGCDESAKKATLLARAEQCPEYGMISCCKCDIPPLPAALCCSPSVLTSIAEENERMLQSTLTTMKPLKSWKICVDVRASIQFEMVHLPDTVSLPYLLIKQWEEEGKLADSWNDFVVRTLLLDIMRLSQLEDVSLLLPERCCIYIICRRGIDSARTMHLLQSINQTDEGRSSSLINWEVRNIDGGLNAYHKRIDPSFPLY